MVLKFLRQFRETKPDLSGVVNVALSTIVVSGLLLGIRQAGFLQFLELKVFDQMVRSRDQLLIARQQSPGPDPRILIVGITEADIEKYNTPLSDRVMAQVLREIQKYRPQVVGLDIFRNVAVGQGQADLAQQLKAPNVISITKIGTDTADDPTIPPPPGMPDEQVGFNDIVTDPDGVVRRSLLFADTETTTLTAFSLQVALGYLAKQSLTPRNDEAHSDRIIWGATTLVPIGATSGGYQHNDAAGYQILLNYRGRQIAPTIVPLSDVLEGKLKPEQVANKIVLIGSVATSSRDFFFTPFSAAERDKPGMPGVEVHAQIISQILDAVTGSRPLFWFWSDGLEIVWLIGWSLAGGIVAWRLRHPLVLALGTAGLLGSLSCVCFGLFLQQGWVPVAAPFLGTLLTGAVVVTYRAQQSQRQQQMIMTLLGQNTSPAIAAALWNSRDRLMQDGKLPGKKLVASMLFTDIRNFSTISEQMPPEDLMSWLNEYLSVMTREVQLHQGIVNKFTGDGVIAVFGVPMPSETPAAIAADARHAVSCALAMGEHLQRLNQDWHNRDLPEIQIRVGIFTGPIVAGSLGGKERLEYGVIGDSVNIASRLESCEKERQGGICRILIAQETLSYIEGEFQVEPWGYLALKGKQQPVDVYRVLGRVSPETSPAPASHPDSREHSAQNADINDR